MNTFMNGCEVYHINIVVFDELGSPSNNLGTNTKWTTVHIILLLLLLLFIHISLMLLCFFIYFSGHVHITDFNIAACLQDGELATSLSGTKPYMGKHRMS